MVARLDARDLETPREANRTIASCLGCDVNSLTAENLAQDSVVRFIVDDCHAFFDKRWFPYVQEQWRALLSSPASRGRVAMLLLGRPLFRNVAGGDGSPLLNIGPLLRTRPLTAHEVCDELGVSTELANAACRKTGGHPALTTALVDAVDRDLGRMGAVIDGFVSAQEHCLIKLAEDHSVAARSPRRRHSCETRSCPKTTRFEPLRGRALSGQEAVKDLVASGLVRQEGETIILSAELSRDVRSVARRSRAGI